MNRDRRNRIDAVREKASALQAEIESIRDEEQEFLDNMPESLQQGERATAAEQAIEQLNDALDGFEMAVDAMGEAIGQ